MTRSFLISFVLLLSTGLGIHPTALAQAPIMIRFSHVVKADTPKGKAAKKFAELARERTNGRVIVQVYDNASLYKDKDEMEAVQLGAVEMLAPSLAKFGQLGLHDFEVFDLPYIFPNRESLQTITQGPIGAQLLKQLEERGIIGLAYWDNGFKVFSSNSPIRVPSDLKGKRMRVQPSKAIETQMNALGAEAVPLGYSDAYRALKTGLVDGTENPPSNLFSEQMHEVQPYITATNHGYLGYAVIVNKRFWENLPRDIREILEKCIQEATKENNNESERLNEQALMNIRNSSTSTVIYPNPEEMLEWRKALEPVYDKMQTRINKELIANIRRINQTPMSAAGTGILNKPKKN